MISNKTPQMKALPGGEHTNLKCIRVEIDPSVLAFGWRWRAQSRRNVCAIPWLWSTPGTAGPLIAVVGLWNAAQIIRLSVTWCQCERFSGIYLGQSKLVVCKVKVGASCEWSLGFPSFTQLFLCFLSLSFFIWTSQGSWWETGGRIFFFLWLWGSRLLPFLCSL